MWMEVLSPSFDPNTNCLLARFLPTKSSMEKSLCVLAAVFLLGNVSDANQATTASSSPTNYTSTISPDPSAVGETSPTAQTSFSTAVTDKHLDTDAAKTEEEKSDDKKTPEKAHLSKTDTSFLVQSSIIIVN